MKVKLTLTAKKTWTEEYPDNDFSDEVIESNFWGLTYNQNEFLDSAYLVIKREKE